jgi:hypothetical protein
VHRCVLIGLIAAVALYCRGLPAESARGRSRLSAAETAGRLRQKQHLDPAIFELAVGMPPTPSGLANCAPCLPYVGGRPLVDLREHGVEASKAAETRPQRDFRHRHVGPVEQPFCPLNPRCLGDLRRRRAEMLGEQSGEMSCADTNSRGKRLDICAVAVERTLLDNQSSGTFRRDAATAPCWTERSCLRSAPEAGAESGYFGGSRTREEADIPRMCRSHRADWPAIDGSGSAPRKKPAVVRRIAAHPRLLAFRMVEHGEHSICSLISGTTRSDSGECGGDGVCFRRARHGLIHYVQRIWS